MEENINNYISDDNTYIGKLVHFWDTKGLPKKKINIILKDGITVTAYVVVPVLPPISQAEEGVFYILPDDSLNYVAGGHWHSIQPDGEDNVIEIIRDSNGVPLPVNPFDKSVTLPIDTTYTFEEMFVNSTRVGWRVRENGGAVIFTHNDVNDQSDKVVQITPILNKEAVGDETELNVSDVSGLKEETFSPNETVVYDTNGTMAVIASVNWTTNKATAKTVSWVDPSDGVYYTTVELNTDVRSTTNLTVNDTTITDRKDIVEGETLLYDLKGTVAVITAAAGVNLIATTITNTDAAQSDGTYKCSVALNDTIDGTEVVSITNVPDLPNIQQAVINETLLYDIDGRVAKVTAINDVDDELTVKTITKVGYGAYVWYYDSTDALALYVSETKNIEKDGIVRIDNLTTHITTKDVVFGKTFITDKNGTVGVIINYDSSRDEYVIKTVAANTNPLILKAENKLSDQVGQSVTLPKSDLTCFTPSWVVDDKEIQWNKSLVFDTVRAAIGVVNDIYAGNNYKITTIYSADAPFVFETTNFSLPDLGQETADLTIVSEKAKFKRVDDNTQLLEEYAIIPGKTTIYARNEGKIGVVSALDSTYGTFKIKTVYEGKSGSIHRMNGFVGVCPNKQDEHVTYPRNRLYTNVSDMVIDKDIWYDTEGNLAVLGSYDSANDTVTLHGIHSTYPQTHYLITSDTLLNTAIGGEATVTDIDVPNMRHDSTFRAYAWTVSDKNGVLGIVTAKTGSAAPYTYTVKTISTASSDSTLWRWLPTGGATYLPQNMMVRLSRADLLASSDVDLNKLVSGKSLIVDANVGVIATITEVIPTGETDPVYDLQPIISSPKLDPYYVATAKLNTKTSGTIAISQTSLNPINYNPYRTYLRDSDGTIAVVTNIDDTNYSYTPIINGRQDIFLLDTYTTPMNVGATTTAQVSNVKYFDNAGQAASGTITGEMLRGRIDNAVLFDKSGNLWSIVDIASNNNTMTIKKLAGDAKQVMVWILSNTNKKLPTGIGTAFVLTYEDLGLDHTSAEDIGSLYPGQLVYDIDGTLAKITSADTNNNQVQVLTITNSNTSPAFVVNIPGYDPDDHTYIPMSERVFTTPGDIFETKFSYLNNLANVTPSIDTVRIGETLVYDGFGGVGIVSDYDITNDELDIFVISVPTHEQTILNLDGKLNGIKLGDIYRLELDHQHLPQWLNGDHFGWMEYPYFDDMVGRIFGWDETNNVFCLLVDAQREWEGVYDPYDESWMDFEAIGGGSMGVWKIKNDSQFSDYPDGSASRTIGAIAIEGYNSADPSTYPRLNDLVFDLLGNVWRITNITTPVTGRYLTLTPIGSDRLALRYSGIEGLSQNETVAWGETKSAVDMSPLRWASGGMVVTSPNKNITGYYVTDKYGDMAVVIGCNTTNNTFNYVMISGGRHFGASYERNNPRKGYSPVVNADGEMKVGQSIELRDNGRASSGIGTGTLEMKSNTTTGDLYWNPDTNVYDDFGYTGYNKLLGSENGGISLFGQEKGYEEIDVDLNVGAVMIPGGYYGDNNISNPVANCPIDGKWTMLVQSLDTNGDDTLPYSTVPHVTMRYIFGAEEGKILKQRCVWDTVSGTNQWTFGDWEELGGGGTGIHYITAGYRIGPEKIIGNSVTTPISWLHDYVAGKQFVKVGELVADKTGVTTLVTSVNYALATPTFTGTVISTYPHKLEYRHDEGLRKNGTLALGDESSDSHDLRYLTDFFGQQVIDTVSTISWLVGYHVTDWAGDEAIITATNDTANTFSAKIISGGGKITGYSRTKYSPVVDSTGTMAIGTKIGFKDNNVGVPAGTGELYINNINAGNLKFSHNASFYPNTWDNNKLLGTQSGGITLIGQDDGAMNSSPAPDLNHRDWTKIGNYYGINTGTDNCPAEEDELYTMQVQGIDDQTNDAYTNANGPTDQDRTRIRYLQTQSGILWKQVINWDHTNSTWTFGQWTKIGGGITAVDHTGTLPVLTDLIYPVGSEYTSYTLSTPQDVAAYLGGTWVAVDEMETIAYMVATSPSSILTSDNLSIVKNSTGNYTCSFTNAAADANYIVNMQSEQAMDWVASKTTTTFGVGFKAGNNSYTDFTYVNIEVKGKLANQTRWKYKRTA